MTFEKQCPNCFALLVNRGKRKEWCKYPFITSEKRYLKSKYCPDCAPKIFKRMSSSEITTEKEI